MRRNIVLLSQSKRTAGDPKRRQWGMTPLESAWENFLRRIPSLLSIGVVVFLGILLYRDQTTPEPVVKEVELSEMQLKEVKYWNEEVERIKEARTVSEAMQRLLGLEVTLHSLTFFSELEISTLSVRLDYFHQSLDGLYGSEETLPADWALGFEDRIERLTVSRDK